MMSRLMQSFARLLGVAIIGASLYYGITAESAFSKGHWFHVPSFVLVVGCLVGFALSSFQVGSLSKLLLEVLSRSPTRLENDYQNLGRELKNMTEEFYQRGPAALRSRIQQASFPEIWAKLMSHLEARVPVADVRLLLQLEAKQFEDKINSYITLLNSMASMAPSMGMLGTVIGLVRLLTELDNMATLGPNMALALLSTLYGIFFGVLVFPPLAARASAMKEQGLKGYNQALFWLYLIENHKPSFYIESSKAVAQYVTKPQFVPAHP